MLDGVVWRIHRTLSQVLTSVQAQSSCNSSQAVALRIQSSQFLKVYLFLAVAPIRFLAGLLNRYTGAKFISVI